MMRRVGILIVATVWLSQQVAATDFVVSGAEVTTFTLPDAGDTLLITSTGSITPPSGDDGVEMVNTNQSTTNQGSISTSGANGRGIYSDSADAVITNSNTITTTGGFGHGIMSMGLDAMVTNSNTITTTGDDAYGMYGGDDNAVITNAAGGTITTGGADAHGIYTFGSNASITNHGTISTTGSLARGILAIASGSTITNTGSVSATAANAIGIQGTATTLNSGTVTTVSHAMYSPNSGAVLINNGTVSTSGAGSYGMYTFGPGPTLTNNGQITTTGGGSNGMYGANVNSVMINNGTITTTGLGAEGMNAFNTNASLTNSGTIISSSHGIFARESDAVIVNSGTILPAGSSQGIFALASNPKITNSGSISTVGGGGDAIEALGDNAVINNSGTITTAGIGADGIVASGNDAVITNSSLLSIMTTGDSAHGINSSGDNAMITNTGKITTTGNTAHGINSTGANAAINNGPCPAFISASGVDSYGIFSNGDNVYVTNSGIIKSAQSDALRFEGTNPTLSLLIGSNIQGLVFSQNPLNLIVEPGLNLIITLDPSGAGFASITTQGPYILSGNTIVTLDVTGLALQADVAADLSDAILGGIYRHRICQCNPCECGLWAQGIGSIRERSARRNVLGYDNWQGGMLAGYDTCLLGGNIRLFGGVSFGEAKVDQSSQKSDTTNYFGGLAYERLFCNNFLGFALALGYIDWDNTRSVASNLAEGGVEKPTFSTGGGFIAADATAAHRFASVWLCPQVSFSLRYAGLFLGNYAESGSSANLSVKDRNIQLLTTRVEFSVPYSVSRGCCCFSIEPYLGVFGRYQVDGKRVNARLLGQALVFNAGSPQSLAAFLVGCRGEQSFGCFNLFLNIEASFDSSKSARLLGEGGISYFF